MRHYEIVFLVHPDQSDQTQSVLNKFYPIEDQFNASYALLNVECNKDALDEIKSSFKFNDSIIRDLIVSKNNAETGLSALSSQTEQEESEQYGDKVELKQPQLKSLDEQPKGLKEAKENENTESSQEELQVTKE